MRNGLIAFANAFVLIVFGCATDSYAQRGYYDENGLFRPFSKSHPPPPPAPPQADPEPSATPSERVFYLRSWPSNVIRVNDVSYDEISRRPEAFTGASLILKGKVIQVTDDGISGMLRVNVTPSEDYRRFSDTVYVEYRRGPSAKGRILEGDLVSVTGLFTGITSYRSVLGATIQIPGVMSNEMPTVVGHYTQ